MRFHLISDNTDTLVGMRLAGIPGEIVATLEELKGAIDKAIQDEEIGVILVTNKLVDLCRSYIYETKLKIAKPLIVEVPDRYGNSNLKNSIAKYIKDAIGVSI
ncbi:MAG: V-type ATP synthase subunit F [Clostridia bacterium]|nr:V-type ATP synthase subunit F [Clostridia bacterium]